MYEEQPQKKSYKLIWIAGASVATLVVIIAVVFALVSQSDTGDKPKAAVTGTVGTIATKDDVTKKLDTLGTSVKQAAKDQAAAKAALNASKTQTKVGG